MNEEMASLQENKCWSLEERPTDAQLISAKWIYKVKMDAQGNVERFKARLVKALPALGRSFADLHRLAHRLRR